MKNADNLTPHFTLGELVESNTATRLGIDNTPSQAVINNLKRTADTLEKVRALLGKPMIVNSGYRCPALNKAVNGAANSAHLTGLAADFTCRQFGDPLAVCKAIAAAKIEFDQLIQEGTWVHIGLAPLGTPARNQILTAIFDANGKASYKNGF